MRRLSGRLVVAAALLGSAACDDKPSESERAAAELEQFAREQVAAKRAQREVEKAEEARDKARNELRAKLTLLMADLSALSTQLDAAEKALVAAKTDVERAEARQQVEAIGFKREQVERRVHELELSTRLH